MKCFVYNIFTKILDVKLSLAVIGEKKVIFNNKVFFFLKAGSN